RDYKPFNYYGDPEAETVLIAMGSVSGTSRETVDYLTAKGEKVGYLEVHLYRPWSIKHFLNALPKSVKTIVVLDRTKENGALADPLYEDVAASIIESDFHVNLLAGRYGIGGKDTTPTQIVAVFDNAASDDPKNHFVVGINDDVLGRSIPVGSRIMLDQGDTKGCIFWGLGSDGTVGANKNSIKIIGDFTDKYIQAFFEYDGKKSGGLTKSHLRFGDDPIRSSYYVTNADFVACHKQSYMQKYDMWSDLKPGGAFLLNTNWPEDEIEKNLPKAFKKYLAENGIKFYVINATDIAKEIGLGSRTNTILQAAFFKITNIIPIDEAVQHMKDFALESYGRKGEDIVKKNYAAVDKGVESVKEYPVPKDWGADGWEPEAVDESLPWYVKNVLIPVVERKGNDIPVSTFRSMADGQMPVETSKYELRGIAVDIPEWDPAACIQCNRCAYVCPNATIRPFLTKEGEKLPETVKKVKANGKALEGYNFTIQVDPLDCVGCGSCASVCPKSGEALKMVPMTDQGKYQEDWNFMISLPERKIVEPTNVKNSQFSKPLLEFPGCCPGCGETPYVKVITQLFGDRMTVAAATGCAAVWATDYPVAPYAKNDKGRGPAMANSLFENNGEYGYGMRLGSVSLREYIKDNAEKIIGTSADEGLKCAAQDWIDAFNDGSKTIEASDAFLAALEKADASAPEGENVKYILKNKEHLTKKSTWIVGGDGWAYDIGYGGLDHVLAAGDDVNIIVLDTEVYSNTGGQASKASQKGAVAQFAFSGRKTPKKDLGMMAMAYGNVYVASVAMGANYEQYLKVLKEAESYPGPSIIIAYAPCINHGIKAGMANAMNEMKRAVECGYWTLYHYDPRRTEQGLNPLVLDCKEPEGDYQEFLDGEVRFATLAKSFPEEAAKLDKEAALEAKARYLKYKKLAEG
ncbi:MAG: pyruvate:ferredoxin (flavodoxin) oxidoreductase, partial [Firmicutes bacterium]|nr:pyruvate:ferredoxin (flavodoxin) oxidoreductase [Bacillota bacterium]